MNTHDRELIDFLNSMDAKRPDRKRHRLPNESYADADGVFFFTLCARHQGQPLLDPELAQAVIDALLWRRQHHGWALYCYCLMPDHLHLVSKLPSNQLHTGEASGRIERAGILGHIADLKRFTTSQIWKKCGGTGSLWQKGSYDHVFRFGESIEESVYYTLNNPVRKGLVSNWEGYPFARIVYVLRIEQCSIPTSVHHVPLGRVNHP